jgi:Tetratricopeptide repeat
MTMVCVNGLFNHCKYTCFTIGDYASAEPLYQECLDMRIKKLGSDHPDTLVSMNGLANLHYTQGEGCNIYMLYICY